MDKQTYMLNQLKVLTGIPSPTGMTYEISNYLMAELTRLGFTPERTPKGTVMCCLGGSGHPLALSAHVDALGAMVRAVKSNGCLRYTQVGGYSDNAIENETVKIHTRSGKVYTGTVQSTHASVHVWGRTTDEKRSDESLEIVVDEETWSKADTETLGIRPGDYISLDPPHGGDGERLYQEPSFGRQSFQRGIADAGPRGGGGARGAAPADVHCIYGLRGGWSRRCAAEQA